MAIVTAAAIAAGASAATGAASGITGMLFQKHQSNKARRFTREIMQNRHQWEVDDLRAAGLNPLFSAGGAPSAPGTPTAGAPAPMKADIVGSAKIGARLGAEVKQIKQATAASRQAERVGIEQERLVKAQERTEGFEAERTRANIRGAREAANFSAQQAIHEEIRARHTATTLPAALKREQFDKSAAGGWFHYLSQPTSAVAKGLAAGAGLGYLLKKKTPKRRYNMEPRQ